MAVTVEASEPNANGGAPPNNEPPDQLSRLVRVDVAWVRWGPLPREPEALQPWSRHRSFLRELVGLDSGPVLDVSLALTPDLDGMLSVAARQRREMVRCLREATPSSPAAPDWTTDETSLATRIDEVTAGLAATFRYMLGHPDATAEAITAGLNRFACRAHLTDDPTDGPPVSVVVDLRFRWHHGAWLYITTSTWSSRPRSIEHAPQPDSVAGLPTPTLTTWSTVSEDPLMRSFNRAHQRVVALVRTHFVPAAALVLCSDSPFWAPSGYEAPRFFMASCAGTPTSTHVTPCTLVDELCHGILDVSDANSCLVSRHDVVAVPRTSIPPVQLATFRRLVAGQQRAAPRYVVVPDRDAELVEQEDAFRELVHRLTVEDTETAVELLDRSTELGVNDGFVRIYAVVAERASSLWDQLAMHLPSARGKGLDKVHARIGLLHVGLLQGVADLDYIARKAGEEFRALDEIDAPESGGVDERFNAAAGTRCETTLGSSLRQGGYVEPTRRWAREVVEHADRVRGSFNALHAAIANAFDEHRVRDTDRLGKLGLVFAGVLALTGLATESWAKVLDWLIPADHLRRSWVVFAVVTLLVMLVLGLVYQRSLGKLGTLGTSREHNRRYEMVRSYLGGCRTERLEHLWSAWCKHGANRRYALWDAEDQQLAVQCAAVIDDALGHESGLETNDLKELGEAIERWVIAAMFVTERPRAFWHQPLPRLTFLYRFYPVFEQCFPVTTKFPPLLSDADFMLALGTIAGATAHERETVTEWGQGLRDAPTARAALRAIERTGIRVGLDSSGWQEVLRHMQADCNRRESASPTSPSCNEVP